MEESQELEEGRAFLLIFLAVVLVLAIVRSMIVEDPVARARAIQHWPVVRVSSRNLVDECGVFMWVRWVGPGFGTEAPYIPMQYR